MASGTRRYRASTEELKVLSVRLDPAVYEALHSESERSGDSMAVIVNSVLMNHLGVLPSNPEVHEFVANMLAAAEPQGQSALDEAIDRLGG
jgi:hypothetical protein